LATGCSYVPQVESRLGRIHRDGALRACSTGDYRPFTHREAQVRCRGPGIEMAGDLANRLGANLKFVPIT
jgi:cyclohexadienyl dehydratase